MRGRWRIGDQLTRRGLADAVWWAAAARRGVVRRLRRGHPGELGAAAGGDAVVAVAGVTSDPLGALWRSARVLDGMSVTRSASRCRLGGRIGDTRGTRRRWRCGRVVGVVGRTACRIRRRVGVLGRHVLGVRGLRVGLVPRGCQAVRGRARVAVLVDARRRRDGEDCFGPGLGGRRGHTRVHRREVRGREAQTVSER